MYNGEVNVKQEHLNSFLSVAEKLRVRGLCQNNGKDTNKPKDTKTKVRAAEPSETPAKRPKFDQIDDDEIEEIKPTEPPTVKQERLETVTPGFSAAVPPQSVQVVGEAFTEEFAETEDYGEYYEDGNYGVDPVDQGQAGKGRRPFFFCQGYTWAQQVEDARGLTLSIQSREIYLYINLACLSVCLSVLSVCLYPINVKTAEPIGPNFFVRHHVTTGKVYVWSTFQIFVSIKIRSSLIF